MKILGGSLQTYTKDDVEEVRCADDGYPTDEMPTHDNPSRSTGLPNRFARGVSVNGKFYP